MPSFLGTPKRRQRLGLALVSLLFVVLVANCAVDWLGHQSRPEAELRASAHDALVQYLTHVQQGDYRAAYGQLCSDALSGYAEADHAQFLDGQAPFDSFTLDTPTEVSGMDGTFMVFRVQFTQANGDRFTSTIEVGMQTDGARVCDGPGWRL